MLNCACAIWLSLASYHVDRTYDYNEVNPGIVVQKGNYVAGIYRNSHRRTSVLGAYHYDFIKGGNIKVGAMVGFISGYDKPYGGALTITVGQLRVHVMPPFGDYTDGSIGITWQIH